MKKIIAFLGASAVLMGALGAHTLQDVLSSQEMNAFKTAVLYQLMHSVALLAIAKFEAPKVSSILWVLGILFFSFSIYLLVFDRFLGINLGFIGPITPLGGVFFVAGWLSLWTSNRA